MPRRGSLFVFSILIYLAYFAAPKRFPWLGEEAWPTDEDGRLETIHEHTKEQSLSPNHLLYVRNQSLTAAEQPVAVSS